MSHVMQLLFAEPAFLSLLALLPLVGTLVIRARHRRRAALSALGEWSSMCKLVSEPIAWAAWRTSLLFVGMFFLIFAIAGPRWGDDWVRPQENPIGDLAIVLDVSHSMLAEQPSRQERAVRAMRELAEHFTRRGGPRVALVLFAAHAKIAFPLTGDYDHLLHALSQMDADDLPPGLRPRPNDNVPSGTRIGVGLRQALELLNVENSGGQHILLLSDGDDPARDLEFVQDAEEARRRRIPVHVFGVGDPMNDAAILVRGQALSYEGVAVKSRLHEAPLQDIAQRTGGVYVPVHAGNLPLQWFVSDVLPGRETGSAASDDELGNLRVLRPRHEWFLGAALAFLTLALILGKGRDPEASRSLHALRRLALVALAVVLVSATQSPSVERKLREGSDAFAREDFELALKLFEQAEEQASDPGLVAFNKAAVLYRLGRYREAELHYRRCLEDHGIPDDRNVRARFGLGNALFQQSTRKQQYESAIAAYRECMAATVSGSTLHADARFNLELARLLSLQAKADESSKLPNDSSHDPKTGKSSDSPKDGSMGKDGSSSTGEPNGKGDTGESGGKDKSGKVKAGPLTVLPDEAQLAPLSPAETEAHLEQLTERILRERRGYRRHAQAAPANVKDW